MPVVYVDSVFVLNGLMDYLLLLVTARLAGIPLRRRRYLLAALAGAAYAVAVFLPGMGFLSAPPVKAAAGVLMALIAYGGEARLARLTLLFFALSCALAGSVLALGLLALTVRALLGRRRLKQAAARYQDPDCRMGCGYILCAVHDLLGQPGLPEDPLSPENAEDLVYLEREVWYSGHTMTEDQRRRCLALLESARRVWREQTPALRRFAARFITCKVF